MILLLTNDDGIEAEGLSTLETVGESFFDEVWVVAPASQMSEIGHRVTTRDPIRVEEKGERRYAVHGTPADCTRLALAHLLPRRPDWVFAGINHGGNLGRHDFVISGTVAAVREAAFAGIPGVAFSHFFKRGVEISWTKAAERATRAYESLAEEGMSEGEFWTVNLPHLEEGEEEPKVVFCPQEKHPLLVAYEQVGDSEFLYAGEYHDRPRRPGGDVDVCFGGDIAVSRVEV